MRLRAATVLLAVMLTASRVMAQQVWGSIRGRVVDKNAPVAGAQVRVSGPDLLGTRTALSDRDGYYQIHALPPGTYTVRLTRLGKRPVAVEGVAVRPGRVTPLATTEMEASATPLDEVRITASRLWIDPTSTATGATLTPGDYAVLPGERDYRFLMKILPDIVESGRGDLLNVNGATGLESTFFIDGMNVTDQLNAYWPTTLPYNVVKAVEIKTGGYEAQYGKALGAVVNATTYSGTNDFAINGFAFTTNGELSAKPRQQPTLRERNALSYDVGARVSGPVVRDRLWYSAAYNPRIWSSDREITGLGVFRDQHIMNVFAAKASLRANAAANFELSVFGDPAIHHIVSPNGPRGYAPLNADPYRWRFDAGNIVGVLRGTFEGNQFLLEASAARSTGKSSWTGDTHAAKNQPLFIDDASQTVSGGFGLWSRADLARASLAVKATTTLGRHTTVLGAEYEDVSVFRDIGWTGGYLLQTVSTGGYRTQTDKATGTFHNRVPTAYLQDGWRVTDALTVNMGLRWSSQTLTAASGRTAQRFRNEWQPRLGVIWLPSASRKDRVYASFGRFYLQVPLNIPTLWYVDYSAQWRFYSTDPRQPGAVADSVWDFTGREADTPMNLPDLAVENADEISVGYERLVGSSLKLTTRAVNRDLRSSFQWGFDSNWKPYLGTPGKGDFTFLPVPVRRYRAVEVGAEGRWRELAYRASYMLSRSRGNFPGLFNSDQGFANPGAPGYFMLPAHATNSTGLLPNDHSHVVKLSGSRRVSFGFTAGALVTAQSGSPVSAIGFTPEGIPMFVEPRGSAGRTPWVWDASFRLVKQLRRESANSGRVVLDVLHVGNPQRPVRLVEEKYRLQAGSGAPVLNPDYRQPLAYQPPMVIRLGLEADLRPAGLPSR